MKIEKISDKQIRCTLSKKDLMEREMRLSELAYGTEKAKALFHDMIQQAFYEFGFEADDIPLMIEAIPLSSESLVLIITKVEDPEELDTRFSKFSPDQEMEDGHEDEEEMSYADEILHCFDQLREIIDGCISGEGREIDAEDGSDPSMADAEGRLPMAGSLAGNVPMGGGASLTASKDASPAGQGRANPPFVPLHEAIEGMQGARKKQGRESSASQAGLTKVFSFDSLEDICKMSAHVAYSYHGANTLYKDGAHGRYYLALSKSDHTPEEFNKVCNAISEYGRPERATYATSAYYREHFEVIAQGKAIQILSQV